MRAGVDVIYQGVLVGDGWRGVADFLLARQPRTRRWSYEALDTKLARHAKPAYILQLCFYTEQLARDPGARAGARSTSLLGTGEQETFRPERVRRLLPARPRAARASSSPTRRRPSRTRSTTAASATSSRSATRTGTRSTTSRRVAGHLPRARSRGSRAAGITTLAALGARARRARPGRDRRRHVRRSSASRPRSSCSARETGEDSYELLAAAARSRLRAPARPLAGRPLLRLRGQPVLGHGRRARVPLGDPRRRRRLRRRCRARPRRASGARSSRSSTSSTSGSRAHPDLHVYHYAAYEITALKRLMGRYGTREAELDDLLRRGVFVDLYKVVRNGLRTSRPGYGLKEMEALPRLRARRRRSRTAAPRSSSSSSGCRRATTRSSTRSTRTTRRTASRRCCCATGCSSGAHEALDAVRAVPAAGADRAEAGPAGEGRAGGAARGSCSTRARTLAAQLLDYHDRERKPVWWAFFDRLEMTPEELVEDAESIGRLEPIGEPRAGRRGRRRTRFTLPGAGAQARRGAETCSTRRRAKAPGEIIALDRDARTLVLKRGPIARRTCRCRRR